MIHVSGLHKRFGDSPLFTGLDLHVEKGEVVVIIGPSGSGKSCLLGCVGGLEPFQRGTVRIGEAEIQGSGSFKPTREEKERLRKLRMKVGFVFQQFNLFPHMTVLENIVEAPIQVSNVSRGAADKRARSLLAKVNLASFEDRAPGSLSGGEQQRVAIARTLAMEPECILFDEPTSSLDPESVGDALGGRDPPLGGRGADLDDRHP